MNKVYRVVRNVGTGVWVATDEHAGCRSSAQT
ncbi:ESPR-type extended signal peptide-containing protein [Burkholderia territorii]